MKTSRGYSLVEALITVAVVATLSAVSMPKASGILGTMALRNDAQQVAALCQSARFLSVSNKSSYRLHWNGAKLELQMLANGTYSTVDSHTLSAPVAVGSLWSADPVFSPRGVVTPAVTLVLRHGSGLQRTITVSITGLVRQQ